MTKHENISREDALAAVIASIAKEEEALANVVNAESDKLRFAIENLKSEDMHLLLLLNQSIDSVIGHTVDMQIVLKNKLKLALGHLPKPPKPPMPPCRAVFSADNRYCWSAGKTLNLQSEKCHEERNTCGLKSEWRRCGSFIILPEGKDFRAEIDIEMLNPHKKPFAVELKHESNGDELFAKKYSFNGKEDRAIINDVLTLAQNKYYRGQISFRLLGEKSFELKKAIVKLGGADK